MRYMGNIEQDLEFLDEISQYLAAVRDLDRAGIGDIMTRIDHWSDELLEKQQALIDRPLLAYLAGPYRPKNGRTTEAHIAIAHKVAAEIWAMGHYCLCPHKNSSGLEHELPHADDLFLAGTLEMMYRSDAVVMLPYWQDSDGATDEHQKAKEREIPIFYYPHLEGLARATT